MGIRLSGRLEVARTMWLALSLGQPIVSARDPQADLQVVAFRIASCLGGVSPPAFARAVFGSSQIGAASRMIGFFFAMNIGRLELMPIFLLFIPELQRK